MTASDARNAVRDRWVEQHRRLGFPDPPRRVDIEPAGLARRVEDLSTRIVILPADPRVARLEFDDEMWEWWTEQRSAPFGAQLSWHKSFPTVDAAVHLRGTADEWDTYLAVNRHGGVEVGTSDIYTIREARCFRLVRTVGLLWVALDTQSQVLRHVPAEGPWQVALALHNTQGAVLGDLAEGWASPGRGLVRVRVCPEPHVVMREELTEWPAQEKADEIRRLAFRLGGRIEDAWGVKQRRFLANGGELEGGFDPRSWRL